MPTQKIHHCRACGEGFCNECSDYKRPVPERGWGEEEAVRVCRDCYGPLANKVSKSRRNPTSGSQPTSPMTPGMHPSEAEGVNARKYGEKVMGTLNNFASVIIDYPLSALKDSARPAYWVPDEDCLVCCSCQAPFSSSKGLTASASSSSSSLNSLNSAPKIKLHHCRQCGQGVCDGCSRGRKPVPLRGWDTPVRVCDVCINVDFVS